MLIYAASVIHQRNRITEWTNRQSTLLNDALLQSFMLSEIVCQLSMHEVWRYRIDDVFSPIEIARYLFEFISSCKVNLECVNNLEKPLSSYVK